MADSFIEIKVHSVSLTKVGFAVLLKPEEEERLLPIFVGAAESHAIMTVLNGEPFPRPLTHDLMKTVLDSVHCELTEVRITELKDSTFFGRVFYTQKGEEMDVDARPSDAIALALRYHVPIKVHWEVFEEAAMKPSSDEKKEATPPHHKELEKLSPLEKLKVQLELALAEERYEDAAKMRDEIRKFGVDN